MRYNILLVLVIIPYSPLFLFEIICHCTNINTNFDSLEENHLMIEVGTIKASFTILSMKGDLLQFDAKHQRKGFSWVCH